MGRRMCKPEESMPRKSVHGRKISRWITRGEVKNDRKRRRVKAKIRLNRNWLLGEE